MADVVSLDDLLAPADPAVHGFSAGSEQGQGSTDSNGQQSQGQDASTAAPAGVDLDKRFQELEQRLQRSMEQRQGNQQEADRQRQRAEALERELAAIKAQRQEPPRPQQPQAPQKPSMTYAAAHKLLYDTGDESGVRQWEAYMEQMEQRGAQPQTPPVDVKAEIATALEARDKHESRQQTRASLQSKIIEDYGEVISTNQAFANALHDAYMSLSTHPAIQAAFPVDENLTIVAPQNGYKYDMRIVLLAAEQAKAKIGMQQAAGQTRQNGSTLGTTGGSPGSAAKTYTKAMPKAYIDSITTGPTFESLKQIYKVVDKRTVIERNWKELPERTKQEYLGRLKAGDVGMVGW